MTEPRPDKNRFGRLDQRWLARALLAVAIMGCGYGERPQNLVLVSIDTLAPAHMSTYGSPRKTTPNIDSLLPDSLLFARAFSPSPWTLPSHAALLTGRFPSALALDPSDPGILRGAPVLAELFQRRGYSTAAFTGAVYVSSSFGFDRGFDTYSEELGGSAAPALEWLEAQAGAEPFFLFFHTYEPHAYYNDRRFVEPGAGGRIKEIFSEFPDPLADKVCCGAMALTPAEQDYLLALYDGDIASADEMIGALVSALDGLDLLDHTTIIVTSDHGEEFWEHTGRGGHHGHTLYDELLHIPLLWFERGIRAAGETSDLPVSLIDLTPTIVSRFGIDAPPQLDGRDLTPLLAGEPEEPRRALFAGGIAHGPARFSIRTAAGKLIWTPEPEEQLGQGQRHPVPVESRIELYLPDDPEEQHNVADRLPAVREALLQELKAHLTTTRRAAARAAEARASNETGSEELPLQTREQLRRLGYID